MDRVWGVLSIDRGWSKAHIAEALCIDEGTVHRYIQEWDQQQKLSNAPRRGGEEALSEEQASELRAHLEQHTYMHTKEIVAYV